MISRASVDCRQSQRQASFTHNGYLWSHLQVWLVFLYKKQKSYSKWDLSQGLFFIFGHQSLTTYPTTSSTSWKIPGGRENCGQSNLWIGLKFSNWQNADKQTVEWNDLQCTILKCLIHPFAKYLWSLLLEPPLFQFIIGLHSAILPPLLILQVTSKIS